MAVGVVGQDSVGCTEESDVLACTFKPLHKLLLRQSSTQISLGCFVTAIASGSKVNQTQSNLELKPMDKSETVLIPLGFDTTASGQEWIVK